MTSPTAAPGPPGRFRTLDAALGRRGASATFRRRKPLNADALLEDACQVPDEAAPPRTASAHSPPGSAAIPIRLAETGAAAPKPPSTASGQP
ncbi:hypothetical protein OG985_44420 [Streptomyces sp. NBC_00289]|uniref:hypothetical protein n=1 Tax=Streptomyces sp. NBC_00289 TaxID=2975703 RepID=UPI0032437576